MSAGCGTVCIIGHGWGEKLDAFMPMDFCSGRILTGSAMGGVRPRIDIPRLIELYQEGIIKLDGLVSGHYKFDQINEAMREMEQGQIVRNILTFD